MWSKTFIKDDGFHIVMNRFPSYTVEGEQELHIHIKHELVKDIDITKYDGYFTLTLKKGDSNSG